jgi:hypothetical protein
MKLNLGCADVILPGYINVDIGPPADTIADLSLPWPWETSSIHLVMAHDIIEHIADRVHFMNELHRVMAPGAAVEIITPNATRGAGFAQDPTHKSMWCMNSFQYYQAGSFAVGRLAKNYSITARFNIILLEEAPYMDAYEEVWKIRATLEAVK